MLPQMKGFKCLRVLFMRESKMDREFDRQTGAASAVTQEQTIVVKREAKLLIFF